MTQIPEVHCCPCTTLGRSLSKRREDLLPTVRPSSTTTCTLCRASGFSISANPGKISSLLRSTAQPSFYCTTVTCVSCRFMEMCRNACPWCCEIQLTHIHTNQDFPTPAIPPTWNSAAWSTLEKPTKDPARAAFNSFHNITASALT